MTDEYFVNTGDDIVYCDSAHEAAQIAIDAIADWRDLGDGEWPEEVERVCYGRVVAKAEPQKSGDGVEYYLRKVETP